MTVLSVSGISIGIAAMIVVLSVIDGFESELKERFLAANAHILAFKFPAGIDSGEQWSKMIAEDFGTELTGISPFIHSETMATKDGLMHNILIKGIHPILKKKAQDLTPWVSPKGSLDELTKSFEHPEQYPYPNPKPIIIGAGLLSILQSKVGETIKLVTPDSKDLGEMREFRVVGVYDSGNRHYDDKLGILAINDAQDFFGMKNRVHGLEIGLKRPDDSQKIADKMKTKYALTIKEWQSFNRQMFEVMEMERAVIGLIVGLVGFVASFNILTTLFVSVTQKQKSISIIKALGGTNWDIQKVFLFQGLFIGILGGSLGAAFAFIISKILEKYELVALPDLYLLSKLPLTYYPSVYGTVAVSGCLICVLAGIYPAWVASKTNIIRGFTGR